jgi:quercetin dioxygenase-like cupin family protein
MAGLEIKRFDSPDETRPFADKGQARVVNLGDNSALRGTFEPGWRWSDHVKPIAKTDSCQSPHLLYVLSGRMKVVMNDGTEGEVGPGDAARIDPGHDAWVVGEEACEVVDFGAMATYAKQQ